MHRRGAGHVLVDSAPSCQEVWTPIWRGPDLHPPGIERNFRRRMCPVFARTGQRARHANHGHESPTAHLTIMQTALARALSVEDINQRGRRRAERHPAHGPRRREYECDHGKRLVGRSSCCSRSEVVRKPPQVRHRQTAHRGGAHLGQPVRRGALARPGPRRSTRRRQAHIHPACGDVPRRPHRGARDGPSRMRQHCLGISRRDGAPSHQRPPVKSSSRSQDRSPPNRAGHRRRPPLSDRL